MLTEQPTVIRWEEPPPSARGGAGREPSRRFVAIADQLRANPGRWALIQETEQHGKSGLATHIRLGAIVAFAPCGDFDAVTRRVGDVTRVYARYLGDSDG